MGSEVFKEEWGTHEGVGYTRRSGVHTEKYGLGYTKVELHTEWGVRYTQRIVVHIEKWGIHGTHRLGYRRSGVHVLPYIFGEKIVTCNRPGLRYTLRLILWVEKQVPATGQASGTHRALYFEWENKFQPAYILSWKTGTSARPGTGHRYCTCWALYFG